MFWKLFTVCTATLLLHVLEGFTSPVQPFAPETIADDKECKDLRDCSVIPLKGDDLFRYCKKWANDPAVKECPMTCGKCKPPHPQDCEDKRDDCKWISENNPTAEALTEYCLEFKDDPAVKECPKTCGMCDKAPFPTKLPTQKPPATQNPTERPLPPIKPTNRPVAGMTGFQKECLEAHNKFRALHMGTPALRWSAELTEDAQVWANKLAADNSFKHDPKLKKIGQGENLAWFAPSNRMCTGPSDINCVHCGEFVTDWYNEIEDYSFSKGEGKEPWSVYLHFTQVVWKETYEVGMATATKHNRVVAVARYRKAGNIGSNAVFRQMVQRLHP